MSCSNWWYGVPSDHDFLVDSIWWTGKCVHQSAAPLSGSSAAVHASSQSFFWHHSGCTLQKASSQFDSACIPPHHHTATQMYIQIYTYRKKSREEGYAMCLQKVLSYTCQKSSYDQANIIITKLLYEITQNSSFLILHDPMHQVKQCSPSGLCFHANGYL